MKKILTLLLLSFPILAQQPMNQVIIGAGLPPNATFYVTTDTHDIQGAGATDQFGNFAYSFTGVVGDGRTVTVQVTLQDRTTTRIFQMKEQTGTPYPRIYTLLSGGTVFVGAPVALDLGQ